MSKPIRISRRTLVAAPAVLARSAAGAQGLRVAIFRCDVTPAAGEPLIWTTPLTETLDPLWAKGILIEHGRRRAILCAMDWCGLGSSEYRRLQSAMARAAGAPDATVLLQSVHQHAAPYVDGDAYRLLRAGPNPPLCFSEPGMEAIAAKLARAVQEAAARLAPVDRIGAGQARVDRVASARRVWDGGKLVVRYSTGAKDPRMAELPEGPIDPWLKTISFSSRGRPVARLHFYATHPQTFCCDGRASADFVGAAREAFEKEDGVFQIYLTGAAGDVTVGKYNDGSERARRELAGRLIEALRASTAATRFEPVRRCLWRTARCKLPPRSVLPELQTVADPAARYRAAITIAFARRQEPLEVTGLDFGPVRILHLPGEPLLEFQTFAQKLLPDEFVAVAGYGDISPGYICPDRAFKEGGYEPSASNHAPGAEQLVKDAITEVLRSRSS
jgi:hypothetical protein